MKKPPISKKVAKPSSSYKFRMYAYSVIAITCMIFYGNTIFLDYALDDTLAITGNSFTKQGISGIPDILSTDLFAGFYGKDMNMVAGGRYRPLSIVTFAIEYHFFGANPAASHAINVILLILTGILLFRVVQKLLELKGYRDTLTKWYVSVPLITALLFIGHPVHTEVIANIKGRDEILSLILALAALKYILDFLNDRKIYLLFLAGATFFLALMSKENAITFLAVIPLSIWIFTRYPFKDYLAPVAAMMAGTLLFLLIRQSVLGHTPLTAWKMT